MTLRLSPPTLTKGETEAILRAKAGHPRDHPIYSLALGTGLRLAKIVGLNVGDLFKLDGTRRPPIRIRPEIAKGGRLETCSSAARWKCRPARATDHAADIC